MNDPKDVLIAGGGLAGMCAARELAAAGFRVTLLERESRLGGKAGSIRDGAGFSDHGYHIFPPWYVNLWRIIDELGIRGGFADLDALHYLRAGSFPEFRTLHTFGKVSNAGRNIFSGVLPPVDMMLFQYAVLDLVSQSFSRRAFLDQVSLNGFIRSRPYRTEQVARHFHDFTLKGVSVPSYQVSAMTVRNVFLYWMKHAAPWFSIPKGSLHEVFIAPLENDLIRRGVRVELNAAVEALSLREGRVGSLRVRTPAGVGERTAGAVLLALPVDATRTLVGDEVFREDPSLADLEKLVTRPMAALDVHLGRRLEGLPRGHVLLLDSAYDLSFIDVADWWPDAKNSALNIVASDFLSLQSLSDAAAERAILSELRRFIPAIRESDIVRTVYQSHKREPFFITDVGAWAYRPKARTAIRNLFLAGDYCRSHVDLTCMEGAAVTGLHAAEAIRSEAGLGKPIDVRLPPTPPRWLLAALRTLLLAPMVALKILTSPFRSGE